MCDYCGCRSNPEIASLSDDHIRFLELVEALEQAVDGRDADAGRALMRQLHDELHVHDGREERGIFVQLREIVPDGGYVDVFAREHVELHHLLEEAEGDGWREAARHATEMLRDHILREESDLFPAAYQMLSPAQWGAVARALLDSDG